mmetsp:Transcript_114816/g.366235  ORF Transcript_114816/g.366235 Transcript_114816/m.366235 type:complete len:362 (+) Transcript_114816:51-1136(+)
MHGGGDSWEQCDRLLAKAGFADPEALDGPLVTAAQVLEQGGPALATGLGGEVDERLLGGGLQAGQICEVFGPAGVGKTQLGLSVAAHSAAAGCPVMYVSAKDPPATLAVRIHDILVANGAHAPSDALRNIRLVLALDFPDFARALVQCEASATRKGPDGGGAPGPDAKDSGTAPAPTSTPPADAPAAAEGATARGPPRLLVVDALSTLLSPFTLSNRYGHRWRLGWTWRALRRLARTAGFRVLLLSSTAGNPNQSSTGLAAVGAHSALGSLWATAASVRLELASADRDAPECLPGRRLRLTVRRSGRGPTGANAHLLLDQAGLRAEPGFGSAPPLGAPPLGAPPPGVLAGAPLGPAPLAWG